MREESDELPECPHDDGKGTHCIVTFWAFRDLYECTCGLKFKKKWPKVKRPADD